MKKKLTLQRETLAELSADELAAIDAAVAQPTPVIKTLPVANCIRTQFNCWNSEPCPGTSMC